MHPMMRRCCARYSDTASFASSLSLRWISSARWSSWIFKSGRISRVVVLMGCSKWFSRKAMLYQKNFSTPIKNDPFHQGCFGVLTLARTARSQCHSTPCNSNSLRAIASRHDFVFQQTAFDRAVEQRRASGGGQSHQLQNGLVGCEQIGSPAAEFLFQS